jgi:hypothetical protein
MLHPLPTMRVSQAELARMAFGARLTETERAVAAWPGTDHGLQTHLA